MAFVLIDSDLLIDYLNGQQPGSTRVRGAIQAGETATSAVNAFEVLAGARDPAAWAATVRLLTLVPVLQFDFMAAAQAAELEIDLSARGLRLDRADLMIAAIAVTRDATLLTRNVRHFERVTGLRIETV